MEPHARKQNAQAERGHGEVRLDFQHQLEMKARCLNDYVEKPAEREDGRKRLRQAVRAPMNHQQKCEIHES